MHASLDHVGLIVPNLEEARRDFSALGFTLTRRADHMRPDTDGRLVSAGSSQHSIMFADNYIELQEITGLSGNHLLSRAQDKNYGLHILAIGVDDADAAQARVAKTSLPVGPVMRWGRPINENDAKGEAAFAFFVAEYDDRDEALYCWTQHLTPHLLRTPRLVEHPNAVDGIAGLSILVADATSAGSVVDRLVSAGGAQIDDARVQLGGSVLSVGIADDAGRADFQLPYVESLHLRCRSTTDFAERAKATADIAALGGGRLEVDLRRRFGIKLVLEPLDADREPL